MSSQPNVCLHLLAPALLLFSVVSPLHAAPWLPLGPDGGDARRMASDQRDHTHLYLGAANGWIYESHNSGAAWKRLARVGKRDDLVIDSIVVDAGDPKHLTVGAWVIDRPDGGLFTSHDGGLTWLNQPEMRGQSIRALAASVSDPKILIAGTLKGVFRSVDGGSHWRPISPPDSTEIHEVESVAIDPVDPNIIYAGTWHLPWKTTDAGEHWQNIKNGIIDDSDVFSIIIDPAKPQTVYASACSGIYKSEDAGLLFHKVQGIPSTARRTRVLLQDPHHSDIVFAGTTEGLFRSVDAGKTWVRTTGPEIIVNDVSVDSADSNHVILATDRGGILVSEDAGNTFHSSNPGFSSRQITALLRDRKLPATIYVGVVNDKEWGGVFQSDDGGLNWTQRSTGLAGKDVFSLGQAPDGTLLAGTIHGLFRLDKDAHLWSQVDDGAKAPVGAATPHADSRTRPAVPVGRNKFAKRNLSASGKSTREKEADQAAQKPAPSFQTKTNNADKNSVTATRGRAGASQRIAMPAAAKSRYLDGGVYAIEATDHIVIASTSVGLRTSADNGLTWSPAGSAEDTAEWRYLAAAGQNVVAASSHTVHLSADAGATWSSLKLPESLTVVSAVTIEPSGALWIGGREGVFTSSDAGATWSTPKNLFINSVNSIFFDTAASRVTVTTGGASSVVFNVQLPGKEVTYTDAGWNLRFARPVAGHLVAATLFDGIVVQPAILASAGAQPALSPQAAVPQPRSSASKE